MRELISFPGVRVTLLAIAAATAFGARAWAAPFAWGSGAGPVLAFNHLPPARRMQLAVAAAAARAEALRNLAFCAQGLTVTMRGNRPVGTRRVAAFIHFRGIGQAFWIHLRTDLEPQGKSWTNFYTSWNGRTERGISYQPGFKVAECVTSDHPFNFRRNLCLDMLGLRVDTPLYNTTLDRYLRRALSNKWQHYRARAVGDKSGDYLVVSVWAGGKGDTFKNRREFWMSANKGFMLWRIREKDISLGKLVGTCDYQVLAAKKRAGIWLPTRIQRVVKNAALPGMHTVTAYGLSHFKIGRLTHAALKLKFPLNSLRLNLIRMRCYFVNKKGIASPRPLYIPQVGKILIPPPPKLAPIPAFRIGGRGGIGGAPGGAGVAFRFTTGHAVSAQGDRFAKEIFPFKNTTGQMVHISKITTSCSCTAARASSKLIKPGGRGEIFATVRLKGLPPHFVRYITVYETIGGGPLPVRQRLKLLVTITSR